jgi:hypothetical protein
VRKKDNSDQRTGNGIRISLEKHFTMRFKTDARKEKRRRRDAEDARLRREEKPQEGGIKPPLHGFRTQAEACAT